MTITLSNGTTRYGSQTGRINHPVSGKCRLQKVKMCSCCGAYDYAGAYWGIDIPLYVAEDANGNQFFTRANTREEAKQNIREHNKSVKFYR